MIILYFFWFPTVYAITDGRDIPEEVIESSRTSLSVADLLKKYTSKGYSLLDHKSNILLGNFVLKHKGIDFFCCMNCSHNFREVYKLNKFLVKKIFYYNEIWKSTVNTNYELYNIINNLNSLFESLGISDRKGYSFGDSTIQNYKIKNSIYIISDFLSLNCNITFPNIFFKNCCLSNYTLESLNENINNIKDCFITLDKKISLMNENNSLTKENISKAKRRLLLIKSFKE